MEPLGVGIVGAGAFGRKHAQAIGGVEGIRLVAASARSEDRLAQFTREHGGTGYRDYRDLLADPRVDAVCITLPHQLHAEAAVAAAEAGIAVLIEKPLAPTLGECDAIAAEVARSGAPFMVAHNFRFIPAYREARRLIVGGEIGTPTVVLASMVKAWDFEQREPWHLTEGGGMWLTNGVHLVDRVGWLLGGTPRDVRAWIGTRFHRQEVDDVGAALITFDAGDAGAVCLVRAIGYRVGAEDRWTEIQGSAGALRISESGGVQLGREDRWHEVFPPDPDWVLGSLRNEWVAFRDYVRGGGPSPVSVEWGHLMVATLVAGLESGATNRVVRLDEVMG